jgi:hypothetical protein
MPMLTVGIRRYTTTANRGFAFGLFYSVMNVGAFASGFVVDALLRPGEGGGGGMELFGRQLSGYRLTFLTSTLSSLVCLCVTALWLRELEVASDGSILLPAAAATRPGTTAGTTAASRVGAAFESLPDDSEEADGGGVDDASMGGDRFGTAAGHSALPMQCSTE